MYINDIFTWIKTVRWLEEFLLYILQIPQRCDTFDARDREFLPNANSGKVTGILTFISAKQHHTLHSIVRKKSTINN